MLVLARRVGESVLIGDDMRVQVVEITSGRVRLGFFGPREVQIDRAEVRKSKDEEKRRETGTDA